jgi:hypothetical protein
MQSTEQNTMPHSAEHPSFTLRAGDDGRVLVYDHRLGVTFEQIQSVMESLILKGGSTVLIPESMIALGGKTCQQRFPYSKVPKKKKNIWQLMMKL